MWIFQYHAFLYIHISIPYYVLEIKSNFGNTTKLVTLLKYFSDKALCIVENCYSLTYIWKLCYGHRTFNENRFKND